MMQTIDSFEIHSNDADSLLHAGHTGTPVTDNPQVYEFRLSDLPWCELKRDLDIERVA